MSTILVYAGPVTEVGFSVRPGASAMERIVPASSQTKRGKRDAASEERVSTPDGTTATLRGMFVEATMSPVDVDMEVTYKVLEASDFVKPIT